MALVDYKLCNRCGAKTHYDANCYHTYPFVNYPEANPVEAERWEEEGHVTLCVECFKTHKAVVVER